MQVQRVQNHPQFTGVSYRFPEGVAKKNFGLIIESLPDEARRYLGTALNFNNKLAHVDLDMVLSPNGIEQSIKHGEKVYSGIFTPLGADGNILRVAVKSDNSEQILNIHLKSREKAANYYQELADTKPIYRPLGVACALDDSLSKLNLNA